MRSANNIDTLLETGLKAYGNNDTDAAYRCWTQVLELQPENAQAKDFRPCSSIRPPRTAQQR